MRRGGMNQTGTGFRGDVGAANNRHIALLEGVTKQNLVKLAAFARSNDFAGQFVTLEAGLSQFANKDQRALLSLDQVVGQFRMNTDRLVSWQGPRSGGPDHRKCRAAQVRQTKRCRQLVGVVGVHFKSDINRRRILVFVLNLGFSQCRTAIQTPVNRLQTLIEIALIKNLAKSTHLICFGLEAHGQVGIAPVTQHTKADKVFFLALDLLGRISPRKLAHLVGGNALAVQLFNLVLNRQAMTVPARHIGRIETGQCL